MTGKTWTDPIVDEIHRVREEMAREADYDLHTLVTRLRESQTRHTDNNIVTQPPRRTEK